MSRSHRAPYPHTLRSGSVLTTSLFGIRSTPTFVCQGTGSSRGIKQTKSLLRKCRSLQSISTILQSVEQLTQSGELDDSDESALLVTMAVQVLVLAQAGAQPLLLDSAADDHEHVHTMRAFLEEHLPAWLAMSPPPPPLHLVAVLHALLLLDGGGGAAGRQGPHHAVSPEVKAALKALLTETGYLRRASKQVVFKQPASAGAARGSPTQLGANTEPLQLPALVVLLSELGLSKCLGGGLKDKRLRGLLWPEEDELQLLQAHALGLCRNFGMAARVRGRGGGAALRAASRVQPEAVQQPGQLDLYQHFQFGDGFDPAWVSPAAAEKEEEEEETGGQDDGDGSSDAEGWEEEEDASDPELDARIRAKSSFLLDLDFLNRRLPEEQRIEVGESYNPLIAFILCL